MKRYGDKDLSAHDPKNKKGLGVTHYTWGDAKSSILKHFGTIEPLHVVTLTPEMCVRAHDDPEFREIIENAGMVVADGVGVCWGEGRLTGRRPEKIPGIELAEYALGHLSRVGGCVYLLGGEPGVAKQAAEKLMVEKPPLAVVGYSDGYFDNSEEDEIVTGISDTEPDLLLVAMGSPKQEIFISKNLSKLNCKVAIGVGGSFDVWSGRIKRAPEGVRKAGMEWLYRISRQPGKRMGRTKDLMRFVSMVLGGKNCQDKS